MIHLETPAIKVLPLQLRDLEDFSLEETVPMVSLLVTSGLVGPPIWAKLEMPVRPLLI
jgi:hypothetical protein